MATTVVPPGRTAVAYSEVVRTNLRLLEVDEAVLAEIVKHGVVIKGQADAFLLTRSSTYAVKYVETSNTLLLLQPSNQVQHEAQDEADGDDVTPSQELINPAGLQTQVLRMASARARPPLLVGATAKAHLELCEARPQLQVLHELLSECPYGAQGEDQPDTDMQDDQQGPQAAAAQQHGGSDMEVDGKGRRGQGKRTGVYSFSQLLAKVQASEQQLLNELRAVHALELDGAWRLVDPAYMGQLLELLILTAQSDGMRLDRLDPGPLCSVMAADGYRPELVRHCLAVYGSTAAVEGRGVDEPLWCLDEAKVCRYFARKVLTQDQGEAEGHASGHARTMPGRAMTMQRFMAAWRAAVPADIQPQVSMLQGEVLMEGKGGEALVHPFSVSSLPAEPAARFSLLFSVKQQWEASDMEPFLTGLQEPGQTAGALLLKYTRASQPHPDGPVIYTAR